MTDTILPRLKLMFLGAIGLMIVGLFIIGVGLRKEELTALSATGRMLSMLQYRVEYAAGDALAAVGAAPSPLSASRAGAAAPAASVPVLLYHGVISNPDRFSLTQEAFKNQMFALKRAGYQTISLADFLAFEQGKKQLPEKSFLLTFDDGRKDSYEGADPVLAALGYNAIMFVATEDSLDNPTDHNDYYLTEDELQRMQSSGRWEIGSHMRQVGGGFVPLDAAGAKGNFLSSRMWLASAGRLETQAEYQARIHDELAGARERLTAAFGGPIIAASYPFGDYGQQGKNEPDAEKIINAEVRKDYEMAFEQVWDFDSGFSENHVGEDPYHLRRIEVDTDWNGSQLVSFLASASSKALPYDQPVSAASGWKHDWGNISVQDGTLLLSASSSGSGADAFLDGSGSWTDYRFTATIASSTSDTLSLIARYQNADRMVLCTFYAGSSGSRVKIEQRLDGTVTSLADEPVMLPARPQLAIGVSGTSVTCRVDGQAVAGAQFSSSLSRGGVGFRIWDERLGTAVLSAANVTVTSTTP